VVSLRVLEVVLGVDQGFLLTPRERMFGVLPLLPLCA